MLISCRWINEFLVGAADAVIEVEAMSAALTSLGLEVEGAVRYGAGLESVLVGELRGVLPHPAADRLSVARIFDGAVEHAIVCGASNLPEAGGKVAFAPVGTVLPDGTTIEARAVRGETSRGMICSESELDLGTDAAGILNLPSEWEAGERLVDRVAAIEDTVLDISLTPNRPDALGHIGVARDLAVKLGRALRLPEVADVPKTRLAGLVELLEPSRCGRYCGYALEDFTVGRSPLWLRVRLHRLGLRPINNAVDTSNYVLLEFGQPLHVFDRAHMLGAGVRIRCARAGESLATLDGATLELQADELVIADESTPHALAGVMGGAASMVTEGSKRVLLEAAWFHPAGVRRAARHHQLHTDASHRFERGVDHGRGLDLASRRALLLLIRLGGARCVGYSEAHGECPAQLQIVLRPHRIDALLGLKVDPAEAMRILEGLGVVVDSGDMAGWLCTLPTHRPDLTREVDLIGEVIRVHGFANLPDVAPRTGRGTVARRDPAQERRRNRSRQLLLAAQEVGLNECLTLAFSSPEKLATLPLEGHAVHLSNPMRSQASVMRTHLLAGLLDVAKLNASRHGYDLRLFELGRTYAWPPVPVVGTGPTAEFDAKLPLEREHLGILLGGEKLDAADLVSGVIRLLTRMGYDPEIRPLTPGPSSTHLHPGGAGSIALREEQGLVVVGALGEVHPDLARAWDISGRYRIYYADIDVAALPPRPISRFGGIPRHPATSRDISLDAPLSLPAADIVEVLRRVGVECAQLLGDETRLDVGDASRNVVEVVEDYRGEGVACGRRALLIRLHYRAPGRSVTDSEVQSLHDRIVVQMCQAIPDLRPR
ncbi:MAG: phenylalanine--tRNA ligase subunit beta [Nannocystaceae bacterium]